MKNLKNLTEVTVIIVTITLTMLFMMNLVMHSGDARKGIERHLMRK